MKIRTIAIVSVVGVAVYIIPISAGPVGMPEKLSRDQQEVAVRQLEAERSKVARAMQGPPQYKGPALIQNMERAAQLDNLINRMKSGQTVSPHEIDRALPPGSR
jgi:hypothetical protein